jgi:hypothetical protein
VQFIAFLTKIKKKIDGAKLKKKRVKFLTFNLIYYYLFFYRKNQGSSASACKCLLYNVVVKIIIGVKYVD